MSIDRDRKAVVMMAHIVAYQVDDDTTVSFEIEPAEGFVPCGIDEIAGQVHRAIDPAVAAARAVLSRARALGPESVEVKFGIKVTGTASWLVAKAATEGNFEVTLSWAGDRTPQPGSVAYGAACSTGE